MKKGKRAGESPIGINVIEENLIFGVLVELVLSNLFVMVHIKELSLCLLNI